MDRKGNMVHTKTKHVMALTYEPKIDAVRDGRCRQTIRKGGRFSVGDSILMHGWEGRPYRSKWSWRLRVKVTHVDNITIDEQGIHRATHAVPLRWESKRVDEIAKNDYIEHATGEELKNVLFGLNDVPDKIEPYQIIRW